MSDSNALVEEKEALSFAGISLETLNHYVSLGVLSTEQSEPDKPRRFRRSELESVFWGAELGAGMIARRGLDEDEPASPEAGADAPSAHSGQNDVTANSSSASEAIATGEELDSSKPADSAGAAPKGTEPEAAEPIVKPWSLERTVPGSLEAAAITSPGENGSAEPAHAAESQFGVTPTPDRAGSPQVDGLSGGTEVAAELRAQIEILRQERDWLRARVERLEARSERDQLLILSESQTVRGLLSSGQKPGFWARALPWFGGNKS